MKSGPDKYRGLLGLMGDWCVEPLFEELDHLENEVVASWPEPKLPLEKILETPLRDYCPDWETRYDRSDLIAIGDAHWNNFFTLPRSAIAWQAPQGTEAIVEYSVNYLPACHELSIPRRFVASGIALIPKKGPNQE